MSSAFCKRGVGQRYSTGDQYLNRRIARPLRLDRSVVPRTMLPRPVAFRDPPAVNLDLQNVVSAGSIDLVCTVYMFLQCLRAFTPSAESASVIHIVFLMHQSHAYTCIAFQGLVDRGSLSILLHCLSLSAHLFPPVQPNPLLQGR